MSNLTLSRRRFLISALATPVLSAAPAIASSPALHVRKDPSCGCCGAWIKIMQANGFSTTVENVDYDALYLFKQQGGISDDLMSCHTAEIDGYLIEGHVPAADISRLLAQRPEAIGLTVPGMPSGSPGMGPENQREAYEVLLMRKDGRVEVFSSYAAA
ncbi:DUF411 domain-containing protein [Aliiroseovarius sp. KMU-50]|uniref:DUF411 domain-containing protein n=1 Tax=Aliiroseovarius salicola TaxID=3009082 RepID=A0ABT4W4T2_9RHOB|nr:DUF411 domain-containing protein [Aliiroseovarius sp. KMU-50]MDA5095532.1 DUF411 domain-containing protein [Aliiroseovarius sp. KMU-50]